MKANENMPHIPSKTLYFADLVFANEHTVPRSGHEVLRATYNDKEGFFKPLSESYPAILAKISVASSVSMRNTLPDRIAEERLVFDKNNKIIGTFSYALADYKPLLCTGESLPENLEEKEKVCPSVATLLINNIAELLVVLWRMKDDDRHPGNMSIWGAIDWDMIMYHITCIIKGHRFIDGLLRPIAQKAMELKASDLDNFPSIDGRTHWPGNNIPGNYNYYKLHQAAEAFQALCANPQIKTSSGDISFQEQLFTALLKELLSHDRNTLEIQLKDYFGDLPVDYLSLDSYKSEELNKIFPKLFSPGIDQIPFAEHMATIFESEYMEFYNVVVSYKGCEKNKESVSVPSFRDFLITNPVAFQKIQQWAIEKNKKMADNWERHQVEINSQSNNNDNKEDSDWQLITEEGLEQNSIPIIENAYCIPPNGRHNLTVIEQRYLQVWRDAQAPILGSIVFEFKAILRQLTSKELTNIDRAKIEVALKKLEDCGNDYCKLSLEMLNSETSKQFAGELARLVHELGQVVNVISCKPLNTLISQLTKFADDLQLFPEHHHQDTKLKPLQPEHTNEIVIIDCLNALFSWIKNLGDNRLKETIDTIFEKNYKPSLFNLTPKRDTRVKEYLKKTLTQPNNQRLALILCTGGCKSTSLNTQLLHELILKMSKDREINFMEISLASVYEACKNEFFNPIPFAKLAQTYVLNAEPFKILEAFNNAMYKWAAECTREDFLNLCNQGLEDYTPYSFNIFTQKNRAIGIKTLLQNESLSNEQILANLFSEGALDKDSFNTILFNKIVIEMRKQISSNETLLDTFENQIVFYAQIGESLPCVFLNSLSTFAEKKLTKECSNDSMVNRLTSDFKSGLSINANMNYFAEA